MGECLDGWMCGGIDGRRDGWREGGTEEGWMDGERDGWKDGWGNGANGMATCISPGLCSPDQTSLPTSALLAFCFQTHHCLQAVLIKTDVSQLTFKTKPQLVSREENIKEVFFSSFSLRAQCWFVHMLTSLQINEQSHAMMQWHKKLENKTKPNEDASSC